MCRQSLRNAVATPFTTADGFVMSEYIVCLPWLVFAVVSVLMPLASRQLAAPGCRVCEVVCMPGWGCKTLAIQDILQEWSQITL